MYRSTGQGFAQTMYSRQLLGGGSKDMYVGIRARELRLIDHNGDRLGVKTRNEALEIAARVNLDLVLVAPRQAASRSYHGLW